MEFINESERLLLRVFMEQDAEAAKTFWGDDEVMKQCLGATSHERLPKVVMFYKKCHADKGISVYAIVEKESGTVIGAAGFNIDDSLHRIELIYHLAQDAWGKGYATEAVQSCLAIAKANAQVQVVYASADPQNSSSLKILEKVGFTFKGMKWFDDTNQEEPYYEYPTSHEQSF